VGEELIGMRIDYPGGRQCKTKIQKIGDKWIFKTLEYAASETIEEGKVVPRDPIKLLESVKTALSG